MLPAFLTVNWAAHLPAIGLLLGLLAAPPQVRAPDPAALGQPPLVVVVPIHGPLTEKMVALTVRSIRTAHARGAQAIVFELDTEGGEIDLMDRIIDAIEGAEELETVAYVTQKAASAGALIAISCRRLYMRPATNIGSALPIMISQFFGLPMAQAPDLGEDREAKYEKILSHFRAHFRAKAQATGRSAALAEAMVDPKVGAYEIEHDGQRQFVTEKELADLVATYGEASIRKLRDVCRKGEILNLTAQEAADAHFIDGLAASRRDLFERLNLSNAEVVEMGASWSEQLAEWVAQVGWLLVVVGLIAAFIELKVPGFGLPGIIGILCLGLFLFGKYLAGLAEITEILLIVLGFGLVALEIFVVPGTLIAGILGVLAIVGGILLATQETFLPQADRPIAEVAWWSNVRSLSMTLAGAVAAMFVVVHFFPTIPLLNRAILRSSTTAGALRGGAAPVDPVWRDWRPAAGARGTAKTILRPSGKVVIDGREVVATSDGPFIEAGRGVVVVGAGKGTILVRGEETGRA